MASSPTELRPVFYDEANETSEEIIEVMKKKENKNPKSGCRRTKLIKVIIHHSFKCLHCEHTHLK